MQDHAGRWRFITFILSVIGGASGCSGGGEGSDGSESGSSSSSSSGSDAGTQTTTNDASTGTDTDGSSSSTSTDPTASATSAAPTTDETGTSPSTTVDDTSASTTSGPGTTTDDSDTGPVQGCAGQSGDYELSFATFHGGTDWEHTRDVVIDASGFIYVAGGTASNDMPVTPGAYDTSFNTGGNQIGGHGPSDAYIAKYTPDGQLVWATYLGGPNYDRAYAIELDPAGDVVISGRAGPGFPTTPGVFQPEYKGNGGGFYGVQGGFIAKLSADGSSLLWSSNVGVGQLTRDFTLDAAGDIYMKTGTTKTSPINNPPAWFAAGYANAYQPKPVDSDDAGLIKITGDGAAVVWATWLGGHGVDSQPGTLKVDADGNVYMAFYTQAADIPTTPGAHDPTHNGNNDVFLAKFSPDGQDLLLGTYVGGSGNDVFETRGLGLDDAGNMYVMFGSDSPDLPTTPGAFQGANAGGHDSAVLKFDPSGKLLAATYLGGSMGDAPDGLSVSADGEVLYVGETLSTDFPVSANAHQSAHGGGGHDFFIVRLSSDLTKLVYSTYLGGSAHDNARGSLFGGDCALYIVGASGGPGFPVHNAWQPMYGGGVDQWGNGDNIVAKFTPI
jgi:hypothetical protein